MSDLATTSQGMGASAPANAGVAANDGDDTTLNLTQGAEIDGDGDADTSDDQTQTPEEEETEEIEREGKKYRVPKALKGELLMHADYTRKTQEVAETRRTLEQRQNEFSESAKLHHEFLKDVGRVAALEESISAFQNIDWATLRAQDPDRAIDLQFQFQQVQMQHGQAVRGLQEKANQKALIEQRSQQQRIQESLSVLSRDIKGWSPQLAGEITEYATREFGFSPAELASKVDPREVKLAHAAMQGAKAIKELAALKRQLASKNVQPVQTVGTGSARAGQKDPDKMSMDEWLKWDASRMKAKTKSMKG